MTPKGRQLKHFPHQGWLRENLLNTADQYPAFCLLETCSGTHDPYGKYEWLMAWSSKPVWISNETDLHSAIQSDEWKFGVFSYEYKNQIERHLKAPTEAGISGMGDFFFFIPEVVIGLEKGADQIFIEAEDPSGIFNRLKGFPERKTTEPDIQQEITRFFDKESYIKTLEKLRNHIYEGDVYEINLTQEFRLKGTADPIDLYQRLTTISPVPFAGLLKFDHKYLISASPERFLQHQNGHLTTQPIKGTIQRGSNPEEDQKNAKALRNSAKEQAENVMIVDLSRNDLNRSALPGTVEVPALFEVQSFAKVHHLVSTIRAKKDPEISPLQVIRNAFPPGSMTGAPKVSAMELIDQVEPTARGIYAGSLGYFGRDDSFDFNVIIRSLLYDSKESMFSWHVGGAITWDSVADDEYEETLVKSRAIMELLGIE